VAFGGLRIDVKSAGATKVLNVATGIMLVSSTVVWAYQSVYEPLVDGRWARALLVVAGCLLVCGIIEAARRRADRIDYRGD
jgi:hypothetical protein